jgi:outer membrane protein OmpA-like peptidoglycan-associated protein
MNTQTKILTTILLYFSLIIVSGCTPKTMVVLLPDPDGDVGHITVITDAGSVDITQAGEASTISGSDSIPSSPKLLDKNELNANFSSVLATLPSQPVHFILYFAQGSTKLTAQSTETLPAIMESVRQRNSQDISVIGHSDTAGNPKYNLQLSIQRASKVRRLLVQHGVNKRYIKSTSHGEANLLIKTADNVSEARNRRVEVVIK